MSKHLEASYYFDLAQCPFPEIFDNITNVWEVLPKIEPFLAGELGAQNNAICSPKAFIEENVYLGKNTSVEPGAVIKGPAWIGENCLIRSGCYIRENVIIGNNVTLGNSCEFKNTLLFNNVEVPHFNYVGDSILGYKSHLGAGVILSNVKLNRQEIQILHQGEKIPTGLRKLSAIIGDHSEIGCNAVINPGSLIGPHCLLYPGVTWQGILPSHKIVKLHQQHHIIERNLL